MSGIEQQIRQLVMDIREIDHQYAALEVERSEKKATLRLLLVEHGNWKDETGYARIAQDSVRASYDTRALDDLIISDPRLHGWLKDYRKESVVRGSVQVR